MKPIRWPLRLNANELDYRWNVLATYNAEVSRGLVHTPEYDARMAVEQEKFNNWQEANRP